MTSPSFTEAEAEMVVGLPKTIDADVEWRHGDRDVQATVRVGNTQGQHIELRMRASYAVPDRLHVMLVWRQTSIRRLDVRDDGHTNPNGTSLEPTHKHRWTDQHGDGVAYNPSDLPPTDNVVAPEDYRPIVEAFCREVNVDPSGMRWTDPDLSKERS